MAAIKYRLNFGSDNTGGSPAWTAWLRADTGADLLPQPSIYEVGRGWYGFDFDWSTAPAGLTGILYEALLNGVRVEDEIAAYPSSVISTATPAANSLVGYQTAGTILSRAAVQLGLGASADPYASTDPNFVMLREYLATAGDELNREHNWRHLIRECVITTIGNQATYQLPNDFHEFMDQSGWNRSTRLPLLGPMSPQEWQYIKAIQVGVVLNVIFRPRAGMIEFGIVLPAAGTVLAFEYKSSFWVQTAAGTGVPDASQPGASADWVLYDPTLMVRSVKLAWLGDRGFDTAKAQSDYDARLEHVIGKDMLGRVLSLSGSKNLNPLISGDANMPITGYGT